MEVKQQGSEFPLRELYFAVTDMTRRKSETSVHSFLWQDTGAAGVREDE